MKPAPFDYVAAQTVTDVVNHLSASDREVKVLAGGQSLIPVLNMRMARPEVLVDITGVEGLQSIEVTPSGELRIGAAVRQSDALAHAEVRRGWPVLAGAISHIGHPQIRNSGTVCGSLAHADSSAELPAVAVLLDAVLDVSSLRGSREIAAADFFLGTFTTDLEPDELVTAVRFPATVSGTRTHITEFTRRRGDFATVGVATSMGHGEAITRPRAVFFGVGATPVRVPAVETALEGRDPTDDTLGDAIAAALAGAITPPTDVHASSELRVELAATMLTRSILTTWEQTA